jgi:hypothetical protein
VQEAAVDLYWLPLGAGGHFVRLNGQVFEAAAAWIQRREPLDLYHSALIVEAPSGRWVVEQAPVRDGNGSNRGVVAEGPVGSRRAGRFRMFRYEVRRWRDGVIPDVGEAVESPCRVTNDAAIAQRLVDLVPEVPKLVWGRDEAEAGEMWNSNSLVSWLLERSGVDAGAIALPSGGRAHGWNAGIVVARREVDAAALPPANAAGEPRVRGMHVEDPSRTHRPKAVRYVKRRRNERAGAG